MRASGRGRPIFLVARRLLKVLGIMMKSVLLLAALCTPVFAQPAPKQAPAKKPNCGDKYVVGKKDTAPKPLTQDQIDSVMKTKVDEVEGCWLKLPDDQRAHDVTAVLSLVIDDGGEVQTVESQVLPAETVRCISVAAAEWEFPRSDTKADASQYAYSMPLRAK
jgi:hypothetical protein